MLKISHVLSIAMFLVAGCSQSLSFDENGFPHGSGEKTYAYESGAIELREDYVNGQLVSSGGSSRMGR